MKKLILLVTGIMIGASLVGCSNVENDILGSWYSTSNNVMVSFYDDHTMERDYLYNQVPVRYDGTYTWVINDKNELKITDSNGNVVLRENYGEDGLGWCVDDKLKVGETIYIRTTGEEKELEELSMDYYSTFPDYCCTVFWEEGITREEISVWEEEIKKLAFVKEVEYLSSEDVWEVFKEEYNLDETDGFSESNPLANSQMLEIYVETPNDIEELESYLGKVEIVRKTNVSCPVIEDESVL